MSKDSDKFIIPADFPRYEQDLTIRAEVNGLTLNDEPMELHKRYPLRPNDTITGLAKRPYYSQFILSST